MASPRPRKLTDLETKLLQAKESCLANPEVFDAANNCV
jgi:hypothetical protein